MQDNCFMSGAVVNDVLYLLAETYGYFIKIDLESHKAEYVLSEKQIVHCQSAVIYANQEYVFAIINQGEYLLRYSVKENKNRYFHIALQDKKLLVLASVTEYAGELIIVPSYYGNVIHINIETGKVSIEIVEGNIYKEEGRIFAKCNVIEGNIKWLFSDVSKEAIRYDMLTGEKQRFSFPDEIKSAVNVEFWKDRFYILDETGNIFSWMLDCSAEMILRNPHREKRKDFSIFHIAGNQLWLMPSIEGDEIFSYDMEKDEVKKLEYYPRGFVYAKSWGRSKYPQKIQTCQNCYFAMYDGNYIFAVNQKSGTGYWLDIIWPDEEDTMDYLLIQRHELFSEKQIGLPVFLNRQTKNEMSMEMNRKTGVEIWKSCKA